MYCDIYPQGGWRKACKGDIYDGPCKAQRAKSGALLKCLMKQNADTPTGDGSLSGDCRATVFRFEQAAAVDITLDPALAAACAAEVAGPVGVCASAGNKIDCLQRVATAEEEKTVEKAEEGAGAGAEAKTPAEEISDACKAALFERKKEESMDIRLNLNVTAACAHEVTRFCAGVVPAADADNAGATTPAGELERCLERNMWPSAADARAAANAPGGAGEEANDHGFGAACKAALVPVLISRAKDVRLNPRLWKACRGPAADVSACHPYFLKMMEAQAKDKRAAAKEKAAAADAAEGGTERSAGKRKRFFWHMQHGLAMMKCLHDNAAAFDGDPDCKHEIHHSIARSSHNIRMSPRVAAKCKEDLQAHCAKVPGDKARFCLRRHRADLSWRCDQARRDGSQDTAAMICGIQHRSTLFLTVRVLRVCVRVFIGRPCGTRRAWRAARSTSSPRSRARAATSSRRSAATSRTPTRSR